MLDRYQGRLEAAGSLQRPCIPVASLQEAVDDAWLRVGVGSWPLEGAGDCRRLKVDVSKRHFARVAPATLSDVCTSKGL